MLRNRDFTQTGGSNLKNAPPDNLQWHPAFCAAAGLEFHEDIERLELKPEYNLSKEPIRIDLLIIKEGSTGQIKNEIGHIMRTYNVIDGILNNGPAPVLPPEEKPLDKVREIPPKRRSREREER